jgi:hypothetical protein
MSGMTAGAGKLAVIELEGLAPLKNSVSSKWGVPSMSLFEAPVPEAMILRLATTGVRRPRAFSVAHDITSKGMVGLVEAKESNRHSLYSANLDHTAVHYKYAHQFPEMGAVDFHTNDRSGSMRVVLLSGNVRFDILCSRPSSAHTIY